MPPDTVRGMSSLLSAQRAAFHARLVSDGTLSITKGVASHADSSQKTSKLIALHMANAMGAQEWPKKLSGQRAGKLFEDAVQEFLAGTFQQFQMLRPGNWEVKNLGGQRKEFHLAKFEPYLHLDDLARAIEADPLLQPALGNSYAITPDIVIVRKPEPDSLINGGPAGALVDSMTGLRAPIRQAVQSASIAHAVVSCKWTLRSDRAQNARSESLNVIRNRKGRTPHVVVVTGEPTPSRLASLALGTGDLDMVYHVALDELVAAVAASKNDEAEAMLTTLVNGKRLRDITDLPLDLCV